jgi:TRAP-type C4-dicarboxylate transport system substrate-binding protein
MDTKLYNDLSSGVSKIVEDLSKEMKELDENEKNSKEFQQLKKIKQDLIKCVPPDE